jgi:ribonuclease HI
VIVLPNGKSFEAFVRLDFKCTNNQVEYEALLCGLEHLINMGVRDVDVYGDSKLMVQQIKGESQCLDEVLNE